MARSGVIYGPTGTYKTTAIAHFAHYIAETTGKGTLLFSSDGGGWEPCMEEVHAGMIRPYHCESNLIPLPILRKASQGYWPINPDEPDISKVDFRPVNWDEIGGIAVEGLTSISTMLMRYCADKNLQTGQEGTSKFAQPIVVNGVQINETFAGNSKAHYGFVQNQLYSLMNNFNSLPVSYVLYTAHEKKFEEDDRSTNYGIHVPGKAITSLVPTWVGDCIHAQDYPVRKTVQVPKVGGKPGETEDVETVELICRYYFKKHPDPGTGIVFTAKPRITHSKVEELERRFPGGFFIPTPEKGFDEYLRVVDQLAQDAAQSDKLQSWRRKMDEKLGRGKKEVAGK